MKSYFKTLMTAGLMLLFLGSFLSAATNSAKKGVYEYVVTKSSLSLDEAAANLEETVAQSSFQLIAKLDQEAPAPCQFKTRVFVLYDPQYAEEVIAANKKTGPFAVVDKINIFEDEGGLHVSIVNPENILRTILMDDTKYAALAQSHRSALRSLISGSIPGETREKPYGPIRKKGYIGRTMGVMAGGPFNKKIQRIMMVPGKSMTEIADALAAEFNKKEGKWGTTLIYSLIMEKEGAAVLGISSPKIESKSFSIVKAGGDKSRKNYSCPGIAHAAAYPMEIVIEKKQTIAWIKILDTMYRMKMYFEDAGKMAFMKNMGMPGSIKKELKKKIESALKTK